MVCHATKQVNDSLVIKSSPICWQVIVSNLVGHMVIVL